METKYNNFKEFYYFYLTEHQNPTTRLLHYIGTAGFLGILTLAIIYQKWWLLLFCPVCGYGFAWVGHFFFEKNKPAAFGAPFFSLISDFIMFYHITTFQINRKLKEANQFMNT